MPTDSSRTDDGVSPTVGVILIVAVAVLLSASVGVFVLDLGDSLSGDSSGSEGVRVVETTPGEYQITVITEPTADELLVVLNGDRPAEASLTEVGQTATISLAKGDDFTIVSASEDEERVVVSRSQDVTGAGSSTVSVSSTSTPTPTPEPTPTPTPEPTPTLIDDFEDDDLSEYSTYGGDGPDGSPPEVMEDRMFNGTHALRVTASGGSSNNGGVMSTSGLPAYPEPGTNLTVWMNTDHTGAGGSDVRFGPSTSDHYRVLFNHNVNELSTHVVSSGSQADLETTSVSLASDTWYRVTIHWTSTGFETTVVNTNTGDTVTTLVVSDTTHTSGGAVGFRRWSGSPTVHTWYDDVTVTPLP